MTAPVNRSEVVARIEVTTVGGQLYVASGTVFGRDFVSDTTESVIAAVKSWCSVALRDWLRPRPKLDRNAEKRVRIMADDVP